LPRHGILNVHASLLPKYRGAAPIQWAIANGEAETGVTIMQIDAGLDTGDMLLTSATPIHPDETSLQLSGRLAPLGAGLLIEAISQIANETVTRKKQNAAEATLAPILKKEDGRIDWSHPASEIYNRLRGFDPWPGAYTTFRGQQLSITQASPTGATKPLAYARGSVSVSEPRPSGSVPPGTLKNDKRRLLAGCGNSTALELREVQPAGKKRMTAEAFLNGYKIVQDERLGDLS
ncbi:MAG: methionyl-tRNA formyltransferase, partial [Acidobacteriota bacterium]|nr:methionyl-tRNA formyltransferase [Acidobacteriota bacterium]